MGKRLHCDLGSDTLTTHKRRTEMRKLMVFIATLEQNVQNPLSHYEREDYFLNKKGDKVLFFYDPKNIDTRTTKTISLIQSGESFPLMFGTRRATWAKKFTVTSHCEYIDEQENDAE